MGIIFSRLFYIIIYACPFFFIVIFVLVQCRPRRCRKLTSQNRCQLVLSVLYLFVSASCFVRQEFLAFSFLQHNDLSLYIHSCYNFLHLCMDFLTNMLLTYLWGCVCGRGVLMCVSGYMCVCVWDGCVCGYVLLLQVCPSSPL